MVGTLPTMRIAAAAARVEGAEVDRPDEYAAPAISTTAKNIDMINTFDRRPGSSA